MIIEFAGIPRTGKSTTAKALLEYFPNLIIHPEKIDIGKSKVDDPFDFNYRYAQFCVSRQLGLLESSDLNLVERGILDRIAYGKGCLEAGRIKSDQIGTYLSLLEPYSNSSNLTFVFLAKPDISLSRVKTPKDNPIQYSGFLTSLYNAYKDLQAYENVIFIPEGLSIEEQVNFIVSEFKKREIH